MQSTCVFSVSESVFSNLLSFPPDSIDLLLRHASSLLRDPSCRFALIERNNDQLQLSFSFVLRTPQGKRAIDECSLWKNGQRDGWCEQSYNDAKHNHVLESVFFAAGTEQGGRLCSRMQNGQKSYVLLENGQELQLEQQTIDVLFLSHTPTIPYRFYFAFRDGYRRISSNNGPDLEYITQLYGPGARRRRLNDFMQRSRPN